MSAPASNTDTETPVLPREKEATQTRLLPPYNVVLLNDDYHSFEFVVEVLISVLGLSVEDAVAAMLEAHTRGRSVVWSGAKEVAELKAEQVTTPRERRTGGLDLGPLDCEIEPAPAG